MELGATHAINYKKEKFEEVVMKLTDQVGVDMILDSVGGPYLPRDLSCMAKDGRAVFIGLTGGANLYCSSIRAAKHLARSFVVDRTTFIGINDPP